MCIYALRVLHSFAYRNWKLYAAWIYPAAIQVDGKAVPISNWGLSDISISGGVVETSNGLVLAEGTADTGSNLTASFTS